MPDVIERLGVIGPRYKILPAPVDAVPTAVQVSVSVPPVAVGKITDAVNVADAPDTVKPDDVRGTAIRV
jgi:hypothetical protein